MINAVAIQGMSYCGTRGQNQKKSIRNNTLCFAVSGKGPDKGESSHIFYRFSQFRNESNQFRSVPAGSIGSSFLVQNDNKIRSTLIWKGNGSYYGILRYLAGYTILLKISDAHLLLEFL